MFLAAPRLVEYWERDPCEVDRMRHEECVWGMLRFVFLVVVGLCCLVDFRTDPDSGYFTDSIGDFPIG